MNPIKPTLLAIVACAALGGTTWIGRAAAQTAPATKPAGDDTTVGRLKTGRLADHFLRHHQAYLDRGKRGDVDVIFLGDSITQKWSDAPELWRSRYEQPLKAANFGIMGDAIQHVLWRVEHGELDGVNPKVVVLLIGTNNCNRPDAEPIFVGIRHLVDVIHQRSPTSKVLLMAIFPREKAGDVPAQMRNIRYVDARLPQLDDGRSTRVLDINDKFYDANGAFRQDLFADGLHPNAAGYQVWADAMQPLLQEMLQP